MRYSRSAGATGWVLTAVVGSAVAVALSMKLRAKLWSAGDRPDMEVGIDVDVACWTCWTCAGGDGER